jgi:transcriptional regulator with GAF, ATPase, and Fis domain
LYYRLSVFPVQLPPLRDRADDISMLVHFLLNRFSSRIGRRFDGVSQHTMQRLRNYSWPGNVRELENILERAVILANGPMLEIESEVFTGGGPSESAESKSSNATLEEVERNHIIDVLRQTNWVIEGPRGAGQILGIHPNTLRSRLKKLGITRSDYE